MVTGITPDSYGLRDAQWASYVELATGSTALRMVGELLVGSVDISIGAVELKGASNDYRVDVQLDSGSLVGSPMFLPVGGVYNSTVPSYTDGDAVVAQFDSTGTLKTVGGGEGVAGLSTYKSPIHFASTPISASGLLLTGMPETFETEQISQIIVIPNGSGLTNTYKPASYGMQILSGSVIDVPSATFTSGTTDAVSVELIGTDKSRNVSLDADKTVELSPIWSKYLTEHTLDLASGTAPSSVTIDMDGYQNYSMQIEMGSPAGSLIVLYTNDTSASPVYQDVTSTIQTNGSTHISFDNFIIRSNETVDKMQIVVSGAPTTTDVYLKKWY